MNVIIFVIHVFLLSTVDFLSWLYYNSAKWKSKVRKNPFEFQLAIVLVNDVVTCEAITRKQERISREFIKNDARYCQYYNGMYILLKTGMRISEFTGLTLKNIDMENRTINIDYLIANRRRQR